MGESTVKVMRTRADKGDGSIKQILTGKHKGKWRARLTFRDQWNRKQEFDRIFLTHRQAKVELKQFIRDVELGKVMGAEGYTLGQWFDWLKANDWPDSIKASTISYRTFRFEKYIRPVLGDAQISMIRPMMVKSFYKELEAGKEKIRPNALRAVKNDLVNMTNKAIAYEIHDGSNPFAVIKLETLALRAGVALTPDHTKRGLLRMYAASKKGILEPWIVCLSAIALYTGMRRGELLALSKEQFDFEQGLITIDRALIVFDKGRQELGLPKKNKVRSAVLAPTLGTWIQMYLEQRGGSSDLLFPSQAGTPLQVHRVRLVWEKAKRIAKFPNKMILHDCRLTHNNWIEKLMPNVSDSTRLAHMGHAASGVNLRYYTRELTPAMDELRKGLEILIRQF